MLGYAAWAALLAAFTLLLYRRPPRLELTRTLPPSAFVGDQLTATLVVRVRAPLPVRVVIEDPPPLTLVPDALIELGGLLWGESAHTVTARLNANRRGVLEWRGVTLRWADPFGLRWHRVQLPLPARLEVYPRTHGLRLPALLRPLLSEGALSRTLGLEDPLSIRGARPYVPGDPPQRVAWKLSAHGGELLVREVERSASSTLQLHLDLAGNDTYVESAVRLAASLIAEASALNLAVSVSTRAGATPSGSSSEAARAALRVLAAARPDLGEASIPTPGPGSNLIVLTQHAGEALVQAALRARAGASRVVIVALSEGFYLEPGEKGRPQWGAAPEEVRDLARRAGVLAEFGVLVFVLRGNHSVLQLGTAGSAVP